jgi:hypothetical protein
MQVEFEGLTLECEPILWSWVGDPEHPADQTIRFYNLQPGDTYIAKRFTGWKMGTVSGRLWESTCRTGWLYGDENIYPYNIGECLKVTNI